MRGAPSDKPEEARPEPPARASGETGTAAAPGAATGAETGTAAAPVAATGACAEAGTAGAAGCGFTRRRRNTTSVRVGRSTTATA